MASNDSYYIHIYIFIYAYIYIISRSTYSYITSCSLTLIIAIIINFFIESRIRGCAGTGTPARESTSNARCVLSRTYSLFSCSLLSLTSHRNRPVRRVREHHRPRVSLARVSPRFAARLDDRSSTTDVCRGVLDGATRNVALSSATSCEYKASARNTGRRMIPIRIYKYIYISIYIYLRRKQPPATAWYAGIELWSRLSVQ